ncbi:MAG: outer membrane beta-barrel protein [Bacteroidota bacterium]|nr:outer membrane beta-barrel protein [Bacteroidota bacterium]
MGLKQIFFVIALLLFGLNPVLAQADSTQIDSNETEEPEWRPARPEPDVDHQLKLGIKMGMQGCTLLGSEMKTAKLTFGLIGGGYIRYNFSKGISVQAETQISFRGSNFTYDPNNYSAIRLLYIDVPVILFKALDKKNVNRVGLGIQYSTLLNAAMYLGKITYPTSSSPSLKRFDYAGIVAYQHHYSYFGFQLAAKYGFANLNRNKPWPDNAKPFNNFGSIHNFAFEMTLIF